MTHEDWISFRQLDEALNLPKGSAFRAFKRVSKQWREGFDFVVLDHRRDAAGIERLRSAGRIYPSTVNLVLLAPATAQTLRQLLGRTE